MLDAVMHAWDTLWNIPHIRSWLTAGWALYLIGLSLWIVLQKREPAATLSWLIGLAALPYFGFFVYYLFGPQKITRHRARRQRRCAKRARLSGPAGNETLELQTLAQATTGLPASHAQQVRLLVDGSATYPALLAAIANARQHVHLEYYIFEPDRIGHAIRDALIERARAGVTVRLLIDAMGSKHAGRRFFQPLRDAGGQVARFHPAQAWMPWKRPWINLRLHRKLVVIDGDVGFIGGINITDEEDDRVRADAYRDLHLQLEGEAVRSLQDVFAEDWLYTTGASATSLPAASAQPASKAKAIPVQVLASGPDSPWEAIHRLHVGSIHAAVHRVWLATPYFVPGEAAMMALTSAALGGLDVRLLVPKMSDNRLVTWCVRSYYNELLDAGVKVYEYGPRMLHSKALLIDSHLAIIGSANFDHRSFRLNFEAALLLDSPAIASELANLLEQEFLTCTRVRRDRPRPFLQARLPEALARLLSPLF